MKRKVYIISLVVLLVSSIFIGCDFNRKPSSGGGTTELPSAPSRTYSQQEVRDILLTNGIFTATSVAADTTYILATKEWIRKDFSDGLGTFQFQMGIDKWVSESNDCDKFSLATCFYAKWLSHSSPNRKVNASLAVGEIFYIQEKNSSGHAINFFIVNENGAMNVLFYEPQTRSFVTLTPLEKFSVFFWKI